MKILTYVIAFLTTIFAFSYTTQTNVIDAVAAATRTVGVKPPKLSVVASPKIVNNVVHVTENQALTINLSSTDSSVNVGIYQNNYFYYSQAGLNLPAGISFVVDQSSPSNATLKWTPQIGDSQKIQNITIDFFAYSNASRLSTIQRLTIIVDPNFAPVFDPNLQTNIPIDLGSSLDFPILIKKDAVTEAVLLTSGNLPIGAKLSNPIKQTNGDWKASLTWKPTIGQIGDFTISLAAAHNVVNASQTTLDLHVQVKDVLASIFVSPPDSQQIISAGKVLTFKLGFVLDPHSNTPSVSVSPTILGATLSKPVKTNNVWYTTFKWKPAVSDKGNQVNASFSVKGNATSAIAASLPIVITVN